MTTRSRWWAAAGLLGAGAVLQGVAVRLAWLPCTGQDVDGLSAPCLAAMDGTSPMPMIIEPVGLVAAEVLSLVATAVLAVAWLVVLPGIRAARGPRLVLAAPSVVTLAAAAAVALDGPAGALLVAIDVAVALALIVLVAARDVEPDGHRLRYAVVLVGATSMSFGHLMVEYSVAVGLSEADWDVPPGTGSLTVVGLGLAALVVAGWDLGARGRVRRPGRPGHAPAGLPA